MKYLKTSILALFIVLITSVVFADNSFIDNTNTSGDLTSATGWSFVNTSATVTCPGGEGDANNETANGDYVRPEGGTQWYKVTARDGEGDAITIDPAFQQANTGAVACNYADVSTNDGTTKELAWVHPALFTTDTVRTLGDGDIGVVRSGQTHVLAGKDLVADESGTPTARTVLMGDDGTLFEEADGGHVTFDFSDTAFQCDWNNDHYWQFENIDYIQSADTNGALRCYSMYGVKIIDCVFRDNGSTGLNIQYSKVSSIYDCVFYTNTTQNLFLIDTSVNIYNSVFNEGSATTDTGIRVNGGNIVYLEDCTFGVTTTHDRRDIILRDQASVVIARRCIFASPTGVEFLGSGMGSYLKSEDHQQVEGAHKSYYWNGTIEKETTEVRSGGATSSIKATPNANTVPNFPLMLMEWEEQGVPASEQTRGVCIKQKDPDGAIGFPTATQLYLEVEYYDHLTNDTVDHATHSNDTITVHDTFTWFDVEFTPAQVQKVRYRVYILTDALSPGGTDESYYVDGALYDSDPL